MTIEMSLPDSLAEMIMEDLEIENKQDVFISVEYQIKVTEDKFEHSFGSQACFNAEVYMPILLISKKLSKKITVSKVLSDTYMRRLLSHTTYDKLSEEINTHKIHNETEAIGRYEQKES